MPRILRWWLTLLAGALIGAGLVLHGQIAVTEHLRNEVRSTFFLWVWIGDLTFFLQDDVTRVALMLESVPDSAIEESDRMAWTLTVIGVLVGLAAPWVRMSSERRKKGSGRKGRKR